MFWMIIACFVVLITVAIVIYLMPEEDKSKKKKKEKERIDRAVLMADPTRPSVPDKDWKAIAERWEKNNQSLSAEIEQLKAKERQILKELDEQKSIQKEFEDKLELEQGWRAKEQLNLDKAKHHEKDLKDQIIRTEKDLEKEHSGRLQMERELQELKIKYDAVVEEKRTLSTKAMSLDTTVNQLSNENKDLRKTNDELKQKRDDVQWVAKSEFDELMKKFNQLKERS